MRRFDVCASDETLAELETVLLRPEIDRYVDGQVRQALIDRSRHHVKTVAGTQGAADCMDSKDNKILALTEAAEAEPNIASNPQLIDMYAWRDIPITPRAALHVGMRGHQWLRTELRHPVTGPRSSASS